jgi:hypothetical protein
VAQPPSAARSSHPTLSARICYISGNHKEAFSGMKSRSLCSALIIAVFSVTTFHSLVALAQEAGPGENINGAPSLQLLAGTTIRQPMPVGMHTFLVSTPSLDGQDSITIDVQEGWTYDVEGYVRMGWPAGRAKFRLISQSGPAPGAVPAGPGADTLAGAALGAVTAPSGRVPTSSAEERGRLGLRNFVGDWDVEMWSLAGDGRKLEGRGVAQAVTEGDGTRITFSEFSAPAFPAATGGGQVLVAFQEDKGFMLESRFKHSKELLKFTGRYEADTGRYVFFSFSSAGETATGAPRQSVRVEIRSVDIASWVADTYSSVEGQSVHVQSYRFTRRSR